MMNRRDLLKKMGGGSLAGLGAGLGLGLAAPARAADAQTGVEAAAGNAYRWSQAGAQALLGQQFWLNHPEQGAIGLQLEAVIAQPAAAPAPADPGVADSAATLKLALAAASAPPLEQFSLLFTGPGGAGISAGSYEMDNGVVGHFALYLVPGEKRTLENTYRAEFSLLV
ncbi:DUF6916 family protein [Duganella sp. PWIR1]